MPMKLQSHFPIMIATAAAITIGVGAAIVTQPQAKQVESVILASIPSSGQSGNLPQDNAPQIQRSNLQKHARPDKPASTLVEIQQPCLGACLNMIAVLNNDVKIDDESYDEQSKLLAEFIVHLKTNSKARLDMIELASTTDDGNKRALIIEAFASLPSDQHIELGHALMTSSDWQVRANGVTLISSPEIMTPEEAKGFLSIYANEPNNHVKRAMLYALKNSETLRGDQVTLDYLSNVMLSDTNPEVRSEAMLTKLALQEDPLNAIPDAFMALTSGDPNFQFSAFIALDRIYDANNLIDGGLDRIDHEAVKRALEDFMNVEITSENASDMDRLLKEADLFYERHFEEN